MYNPCAECYDSVHQESSWCYEHTRGGATNPEGRDQKEVLKKGAHISLEDFTSKFHTREFHHRRMFQQKTSDGADNKVFKELKPAQQNE